MSNSQRHEARTGISRRTFMAGAVAAGVAGIVGTLNSRTASAANQGEAIGSVGETDLCAPHTNGTIHNAPDKVSEDQIIETIDCDIVIVGAGVAGMAAVMYSTAQGANVHVLEKGPHEGVHRIGVAGVNSKLAEAITDDKSDIKQYCMELYCAMAGFQTKMPHITRYAKDSGKWIDWLSEAITPYGWKLVPFGSAGGSFNTRVKPDTYTWPVYGNVYCFENPEGESLLKTFTTPNWMALFRQIADDNGAQFHFNEPGYYLEREEGGRVTSIVSRNLLTGEYRRYNAAKGILLAAGDFYNDKELVHEHAIFLERCVSSITEPNNTGDMHKAALWVGAAMDDYSAGDLFAFQNVQNENYACAAMPGDEGYNPIMETTRGCMWAPAVASLPVLWVDDGGRRFVNEDMNNFQLAGAQTLLTTPTGKAWSIWDSEWESKMPDNFDQLCVTTSGVKGMFGSINKQSQVEKEVEAGLIQRYDTLEELAEGCGFDKNYFLETVERYNKLCEMGEDVDCLKDAIWLASIDAPPFYAAHWGVMITSTRCGVKTDEHSRVIDTEGQIIPGLYAAGNNGGNFYGVNYPGTFGGTGIGHGQFFSWVAARDMLGEDVINMEEY